MQDLELKIERVFVKDQAYKIIRDLIISGELEPNSKLNVSELSEKLNISKTPVREALIRLEDKGLVITKANQWTIVSPIDIEEANNLYPIIYELESLALREGFSNIDESFINELKSLNEKIKNANSNQDIPKLLELDNQFHATIINLSNNPEIMPLIKSLKFRLKRIELYFFKNNESHFQTYEEHNDIISSLEERDLQKSLEKLKINWDSTLNLTENELI